MSRPLYRDFIAYFYSTFQMHCRFKVLNSFLEIDDNERIKHWTNDLLLNEPE